MSASSAVRTTIITAGMGTTTGGLNTIVPIITTPSPQTYADLGPSITDQFIVSNTVLNGPVVTWGIVPSSDPNKYFHTYNSGNLRTGDPLVGDSSIAAPPGTYNIMQFAIDGQGGTGFGGMQILVSGTPVVNNQSVPITGPTTGGQFIATVTATHRPLLYQITGGDNPHNFDFAGGVTGANNDGTLNANATNPPSPGTYTLTVLGSNANGPGTTGTITVTVSGPAAPVITPNTQNFSTNMPLHSGAPAFGTMFATNSPNNWAITGNNPLFGGQPAYAIAANGDLTFTAVGAANVQPGVTNLTVTASNATGTSLSGTASVTVVAAAVPVITPNVQNFGITLSQISAGTPPINVGSPMTATNSPNGWQLVSVTPSTALTWFQITNAGQIQVTTTGKNNITAQNYTLNVTASNTNGTSAQGSGVVAVSAINDGLSAAPPGAAPFPNALAPFGTAPGTAVVVQPQNKTYLRRPTWHVAGVDYNVGPNSTPTTTAVQLQAANPSTMSINGNDFHINSSSATTIVVNGVDFTIGGLANGGGYTLTIAAPNVIVRNCKFGWNYGGDGISGLALQIDWEAPSKTLLIEYCYFDSRNWNYANGQQGIGGYVIWWSGGAAPNAPTDLTLHYNWFRGIPNHIVSSTMPSSRTSNPPLHLEWKFNLISEMGEGAPGGGGSAHGSHFNATEWGGIPDNSTFTLQFNTALYMPWQADNQTWQNYPNSQDLTFSGTSTSTADFGWNTFLAPDTNVQFVRDPGTAASNPPGNLVDQGTTGPNPHGWTNLNYCFGIFNANTSFKVLYHDNYYDKSGSVAQPWTEPGNSTSPHKMIDTFVTPVGSSPYQQFNTPADNWDMIINQQYPPDF